jgi:hypothetical protein
MLSPQVSEGDGVAKNHLNVPCSVTIEQENGEWIVRVCDENAITQVKSFRVEAYARNFAEGQRLGLGLDKVEHRLDEPSTDGSAANSDIDASSTHE